MLEIGKKFYLDGWEKGFFIIPLFLGEFQAFIRTSEGHEYATPIDSDWLPIKEMKTVERWVSKYVINEIKKGKEPYCSLYINVPESEEFKKITISWED